MDFKVTFQQTFIEDLERIVRNLAVYNPDAAQRLGELIITTCESLRFFPERHPRVRQRAGIRRFVVRKNFKVFYRPDTQTKTVQILRCWDGRQANDPLVPTR
jgi:plasmid stabilization system protein ParE